MSVLASQITIVSTDFQQLVKVNNKKTQNLHIIDPLWGYSTNDQWFPAQMASCAEMTSQCAQGPRKQSSWGQHGAHLGPVGPRWAPCWPHAPCYQGHLSIAGPIPEIMSGMLFNALGYSTVDSSLGPLDAALKYSPHEGFPHHEGPTRKHEMTVLR